MNHSFPTFFFSLFVFVTLSTGFAQDGLTGISVSGSGVVYGEPDQAVVELGVSVTDEDLSTATREANERTSDILEALTALDIAPEDVRTTRYSVWPEERYSENNTPQTVRYRVDSGLSVTVRDFARLGEVLSAALEAGANTVGNVSFTLSDPAALEAEARSLAVEDARAKAEQLASLSGVSLGPVLMISNVSGTGSPIPFPAARMQMEASAADVPVAAGQLSVSSSVQVRYAIQTQD